MARRLPTPRPMPDPNDSVSRGQSETNDLAWPDDASLRPGATVEATDGPVGILRQRRRGEGPEHAYLGVETSDGMLYIPERLIRETRGDSVVLSLPGADVRANSSVGSLPTLDPIDPTQRPGPGPRT
jgi:hypothetical protein